MCAICAYKEIARKGDWEVSRDGEVSGLFCLWHMILFYRFQKNGHGILSHRKVGI